jgi:two-component system sensor kinase FixL
MINPIMQGRDRVIDVVTTSIAWFAQQRYFLQSFSPDIRAFLTSGATIRERHDSHSTTSTQVLLPSLHCDIGVSSMQATADPLEDPDSAPGWRGRVVTCVSWLLGGGRGTRRMLNARIPLREALEMMPVPIVTVDHRNQITFANARTIELFGYTREQLAGASAEMLFPIRGVGGDHLEVEERGDASQIAGVSTTQVLVARRRDGVGFPAETNTTKYTVHDQVLRIIAISDRSASQEVDRNRKELVHLARVSSLGELAGSLAHELKQPLTAILFNAQAAQKYMESETADKAELRGALEDIVTDNRRASEVIQKIRTLARKGDIELQPLDVGDVVRDIAVLVHSDALTRGVRTRFDISENLAMVWGDRVQLQQVVLNLLLNAFDAVKECAPAERVVETTVREEPDGGVRITVKDNGLGLTVDKMDKIFRAFFTTKLQGLGLGLSISRTIITGHGGRIWAENNNGKGASFHVTLPQGTGFDRAAAHSHHEPAHNPCFRRGRRRTGRMRTHPIAARLGLSRRML